MSEVTEAIFSDDDGEWLHRIRNGVVIGRQLRKQSAAWKANLPVTVVRDDPEPPLTNDELIALRVLIA
jgi:hypothetical protein